MRGVIAVSAGNHAQALAWGAAEEGIDALVVMWQGASAVKVAATRGLRRHRRPRSTGPTATRSHACTSCVEETGRVFVHPFDDPLVIAGRGRWGSRSSRTCPTWTRSSCRRRRRARVGDRGRLCLRRRARRRGRAGGIARRSARASPRGEPVPVTPGSIADALSAPFAGTLPIALCGALGVEVVTRHRRRDRGGVPDALQRAKLAVEPGRSSRPRRPCSRAGSRADRIVAVVSGGNVAAQTASDILAGR